MNLTQQHTALGNLLKYIPKEWLELTTHRLDIYHEAQAKSEFLTALKEVQLESLDSSEALSELPTAYDYIRLGHQLSSVLEWVLAESNQLAAEQLITFASKTMPILAVLRTNKLLGRHTKIYYTTQSLPLTDLDRLLSIYGYDFELVAVPSASDVPQNLESTSLFVTESDFSEALPANSFIDAWVNLHSNFGSAIAITGDPNAAPVVELIKNVQHVRRRESIAMTPGNAYKLLQEIFTGQPSIADSLEPNALKIVNQCIQLNTGATHSPLVASSGLSIQYAIMMGLVEDSLVNHPGKPLKIILPPNCYGGTNDQARRVAALIPSAEIIDLLVDGGNELVSSLENVLEQVAQQDGVPLVLAEIPTNPRVEVPNMETLGMVLSKQRTTSSGTNAVAATFMVDQTFCPNVKLLHQESPLAQCKVISFSSGSKFPSGGRCIAGYCASNARASEVQTLIAKHLALSDNQAVTHQLNTLAENMPSMPQRIESAYQNTRLLVEHIQQILPTAKINFVSKALAEQGFTPSVFSLDLPAKGDSQDERENYKRALNLKLINFMIKRHPNDCKYCVSYGQLKGSYWTIPATSTQGTTKETDKDYIVRVALSPQVDIPLLKKSFTDFCQEYIESKGA
ncbi:hypothetical protein ACUR5C_12625 [Aliikangiella sp. IMCC44653]